ncbi:uncharacterized protein EV154DRAFT_163762 [Mucor mucedo]|uniref:uncharacterized protein n=1 Tax=Mucor mucedo TaxID=29922 RepID=UPI00221FBE14|nr:uncharacterized protein EV154DRAFT_163762 [Mucor mucedo]KAI7893003.1 hypothetical protein EV154DRAFT_163762 [Mucor mucedo]
MEGGFNYFECPYCISFYFDEEFVYASSFNSGSDIRHKLDLFKDEICKASLIYDATTGQILGEENIAYTQRPSEDNDTIVYVENVFMELNGIYLKRKSLSYKSSFYDDNVLHTAVLFLRRVGNRFRTRIGILGQCISSYHYSLNMPPHWDPTIKDELIWNLFVEAELVRKDDHRGKIIFHDQIDTKLKVATMHYKGLRNGSYVIYIKR